MTSNQEKTKESQRKDNQGFAGIGNRAAIN